MKAKILNYGSLNIDHVYRLPHFALAGETLTAQSLQLFAGGKGANQSIALARAGVQVWHAGKIGEDGKWLKEKLEENGVNTQYLKTSALNSGHAIIQVDDQGENAIVIYAGANRDIQIDEMDQILSRFDAGDYLLLQNEINDVDKLIEKGKKGQMKICFNPAPFSSETLSYPLDQVDLLIVNETEGVRLSGKEDYQEILRALTEKYPETEVLLTVGQEGAFYASKADNFHVPAEKVNAIDTTAAGDTFIGYFLACRIEGMELRESVRLATKASARCIEKQGAMDAIPLKEDVFS